MKALPNISTRSTADSLLGDKLAQLHADLLHYCTGLTGSRHAAEDLVQDTFLKALHLLQQKMPHPNPGAYLKRIARNQWIDLVRRSARYEDLLKLAAAHQEETGAPWKAMEQSQELENALKLMISCLSPLQRTVFLLREALSLTGPETAALLNTTEGAVKLLSAAPALHCPVCRMVTG